MRLYKPNSAGRDHPLNEEKESTSLGPIRLPKRRSTVIDTTSISSTVLGFPARKEPKPDGGKKKRNYTPKAIFNKLGVAEAGSIRAIKEAFVTSGANTLPKKLVTYAQKVATQDVRKLMVEDPTVEKVIFKSKLTAEQKIEKLQIEAGVSTRLMPIKKIKQEKSLAERLAEGKRLKEIMDSMKEIRNEWHSVDTESGFIVPTKEDFGLLVYDSEDTMNKNVIFTQLSKIIESKIAKIKHIGNIKIVHSYLRKKNIVDKFFVQNYKVRSSNYYVKSKNNLRIAERIVSSTRAYTPKDGDIIEVVQRGRVTGFGVLRMPNIDDYMSIIRPINLGIADVTTESGDLLGYSTYGLTIVGFLTTVYLFYFGLLYLGYSVVNSAKQTVESTIRQRLIDKYSPVPSAIVEDIVNLKIPKLDSDTKLLLLRLKKIIHVVYHLYCCDISSAIEHASDFLITDFNVIIDFIKSLKVHHLLGLSAVVTVPVVVGGVCYNLKFDDYDKYIKNEIIFEDIPSKHHVDPVEDEASDMSDFFGYVSTWFTKSQMVNMTDHDIRNANAQFQYLNYINRQVKESTQIVMNLITVMCKFFFFFDPFDPSFQNFTREIIDFHCYVGNTHISENPKTDRAELQQIVDKFENAIKLKTDYRMQQLPKFLSDTFNRAYVQLEIIAAEANNVLRGYHTRACPVSIILTGPPGAGKSPATQYIIDAMCYYDGIESDSLKVFNFNPKSDYMEGYNQQPFVVFDDIFMSTDAQKRNIEATNIISMVNTAIYMLNMAFGDKGKMFFNSKYIIMSTNAANNGIQFWRPEVGLTDNKALFKRFHIALHRTEVKTDVNQEMDDVEFRIDKCDAFPEWIGQTLPLREIVKIIRRIKLYNDNLVRRPKRDRNHFANILGEEHRVEIIQEEVKEEHKEVQNVETHTLVNFSPLGYGAKFIDWLVPPSIKQKFAPRRDDMPVLRRHDYRYDSPNVQLELMNVYDLTRTKEEECRFAWNNNRPEYRMYHNQLTDLRMYRAELERVPWYTYFRRIDNAQEFDYSEFVAQNLFGNSEYRSYYLYIVDLIPTYMASFAVGYTVTTIIVKVFGHTVTTESYQNKIAKVKNDLRSNTTKLVLKRRLGKGVSTQSGEDSFQLSISKSIMPGIFSIVGNIKGVPHRNAVAYHYRDGYMLTCAHHMLYFAQYDDVTYTISRDGDKPLSFTFALDEDFVMAEGVDLVEFKLPKKAPKLPQLSKYFAPEDTPPYVFGQQLYVVGVDSENHQFVYKASVAMDSPVSVPYTRFGNDLVIERPIAYDVPSVPGNSGSLVITKDKNDRVMIIGMHIGKSTIDKHRFCVAIRLYKETLDEFLNPDDTPVVDEVEVHAGDVFPRNVLRKIDPPHYPPRVSKIHRTSLYGCFGSPICVPARLSDFMRDGELVSPLFRSMHKLHESDSIIYSYSEQRVINFLLKLYPRINNPKVLTIKESVEGIPGEFSSICQGTSPGYPYSIYSTKGKAPYIMIENNSFIIDESFYRDLCGYNQKLLEGEQIEVYWADVLKDEVRPLAKVEKPRLFSTCPLHYLVLVRMYCLEFVEYVQSRCVTHPVSVGINPHSVQWNILYVRLANLSGSVIAGDFSNYDGNLPAGVIKTVCKFINVWYNDGPVNARVRELLFEHIYNSRHVIYDNVYQLGRGNPSGNPITSILNSFANVIMVYVILTVKFNVNENEFDMVCYGDDNVIVTKQKGITCKSLTPHFLEMFNMTYTHYSKEDVDVVDTLDTISYLSRKFINVEGFIRAPLPLDTICESLYWYKGRGNEIEILSSTIQSFYLELSHYPRDVYFDTIQALFLYCQDEGMFDLLHIFRKLYNTYDHYVDIMYTEDKMRPIEVSEIAFGFYPEKTYVKQYLVEDVETHSGISPPWLDDLDVDFKFQQVETHAGDDAVNTSETRTTNDRGVIEVQDTQQVQLGAYQDAAPIDATGINSEIMQEPFITTNMETYNLSDVLNREYNVYTLSWSSSSAIGASLLALEFPSILFAQTFIAQKLDDFRYFKAGIRVSMRVSASSFLYGKLLVAYMPAPDVDAYYNSSNDIYNISGFPHVLLSASSSETVVFDIPFISKYRALDLNSYTSGEMGQFKFVVMNPLTNIENTASTAKVFITAQFLDAEVFLPHTLNVSMLRKVEVETHSGRGMRRIRGKEALLKSEKKTISSQVQVKQPETVFMTATRYARNTIDFIEKGLAIASMIGLSKPSSDSRTDVMKINPFSDFNNANGVDLSVGIGFDPDNGISTQPVVGGISIDELELKYIVGTPMLSLIQTITNSPLPFIIANIAPGSVGTALTLVYVDWITNLFVYASGSYKFKGYFCASQMHAVRVVFYLTDAGSTANTVEWQDCNHRVVDINGDTDVEFTIPYCSQHIMTDGVSEPTFAIWCQVLSWSQANDSVATPIYLNMYKAGADDWQFGCFKDTAFQCQCNPRHDFMMPFEPIHPGVKAYKHQGFLMGEKYESIRHIIHRYHPITQASSGVVPTYSPAGNIPTKGYTGVEMLGLIFQFWRGSRRFRFVTTDQNVHLAYANAGGQLIQGVSLSCMVNPSVDISVPYYNKDLYNNTRRSANSTDSSVRITTTQAFYFASAGDDFSFHFLCPPPLGNFVTPPTTYGIQGAATFFT
jgi:hypothetical protein